jgi:hypothetical protein
VAAASIIRMTSGTRYRSFVKDDDSGCLRKDVERRLMGGFAPFLLLDRDLNILFAVRLGAMLAASVSLVMLAPSVRTRGIQR